VEAGCAPPLPGDGAMERTSLRAGFAPDEVQRVFTAHCFANHNTALRKTWSVSFQQSPIVSQNLENGMSLLRVGGSHVGFEPTTYVVDDIWRDVLVGKLQFRVNTYRRASSNQFGRRMQRKDVMEETLCVRFGVVVIVETQVLPIGCQSNAVEVFVRPQNIDPSSRYHYGTQDDCC